MRFAELPLVPWRNGGGVTREVAVDGSGGRDFEWRISIADVSVAGPFSAFPGVDRSITLLDGERMDLLIDGVDQVLCLHETLTFDGASQTSCTLPCGPTRDLNVMTRRDRRSAVVTVADLSETLPISVAVNKVLVLLSGSGIATSADGRRTALRPLDALCPTGSAVTTVVGSGQAAVVLIRAPAGPCSRCTGREPTYIRASSEVGRSTQSATNRRNPPAVPPSHTRWSNVNDN